MAPADREGVTVIYRAARPRGLEKWKVAFEYTAVVNSFFESGSINQSK